MSDERDPAERMRADPPPCRHNLNTGAEVNVVFVEDIGRYVADVRVKCLDCGSRFRWLGIPAGLDYDKPTVSADAFECRLPLAPEGQSVPPIEGTRGYSIKWFPRVTDGH